MKSIPEIEITCPLKSRCEYQKKDVIYRCAWYIKIVGKDPQSEKEFDEWRCAIAWQPIIGLENAQKVNQQTHSIDSFRNNLIKSITQLTDKRKIDNGNNGVVCGE